MISCYELSITLSTLCLYVLRDHINVRGTQFLAIASANHDHQCHYMLAHQQTPYCIKTTQQAQYTGLLSIILWTFIAIQKLGPNIILATPHPDTTRNLYNHVGTEWTSAGFIRGITFRWPCTAKGLMTILMKPAYSVTLPPIVSTHHDTLSRTHTH